MTQMRTGVPRGPKRWCDPPEAFGKVNNPKVMIARRVWLPPQPVAPGVPVDPIEVAQFRAAVVQNAIAVHVRQFKNGMAMTREGLADLDRRLNSLDLWDARLNGHENLTTQDIATLMAVLPGAMPDPGFVGDFLSVAQGGPRPVGWTYPDS